MGAESGGEEERGECDGGTMRGGPYVGGWVRSEGGLRDPGLTSAVVGRGLTAEIGTEGLTAEVGGRGLTAEVVRGLKAEVERGLTDIPSGLGTGRGSIVMDGWDDVSSARRFLRFRD